MLLGEAHQDVVPPVS